MSRARRVDDVSYEDDPIPSLICERRIDISSSDDEDQVAPNIHPRRINISSNENEIYIMNVYSNIIR